jgi:predicted 3-demethylubiquinone-9 3-methyltransferase (glyoxalase superfamily)
MSNSSSRKDNVVQKIRPFLWFDGRAVEAARFYVSIFKNAAIVSPANLDEVEAGEVMSVTLRIEGQELIAFNGGPHFTFSPAISFFVNCETQEEIDYFWERLTDDGEESRCGWLQDKFGVSWQIVPSVLGDLLQQEDEAKSDAVMQTMLAMKKLDIASLQKASGDA